jgi:hypothetical protein
MLYPILKTCLLALQESLRDRICELRQNRKPIVQASVPSCSMLYRVTFSQQSRRFDIVCVTKLELGMVDAEKNTWNTKMAQAMRWVRANIDYSRST